MFWFAFYFPLVLSLTLFTSGGVFLLFLFFPARSFQMSATSPAGGHDSLFLLLFFFHFLFSRFFFLVFVFLCFLSFLYFIEYVCRACRIRVG